MYPEHQWLAGRALSMALTPDELSRFHAAIESFVPPHLKGVRFCPAPQALAEDKSCFALPDLPALAGDHASSPSELIRRLLQARNGTGGTALGYNGASGVRAISTALPTFGCKSRAVRSIPRLIAAVREHRIGVDPRPDLDDLDTELARQDPNYVCYALHDAYHFREPGTALPFAAADAVHNNAVRSYARFHLMALTLAQIAAQAAEPSEQANAFAMAVVYELFALHFLQDALAAGHVVTQRLLMNPPSVRDTHDHYNHAGIPLLLSSTTCEFAADPANPHPTLQAACAGADGKPPVGLLRGDRAIVEGWLDDRDDLIDVTADIATLSAIVSLHELLHGPHASAGHPKQPHVADPACAVATNACLTMGVGTGADRCWREAEQLCANAITIGRWSNSGSHVLAIVSEAVNSNVPQFESFAAPAWAMELSTQAWITDTQPASGVLSVGLVPIYTPPVPVSVRFAALLGVRYGRAGPEGRVEFGPTLELAGLWHHFAFGLGAATFAGHTTLTVDPYVTLACRVLSTAEDEVSLGLRGGVTWAPVPERSAKTDASVQLVMRWLSRIDPR